MPAQMPRSAADPATTWDLTAIYPNEEAFILDERKLKELTADFTRQYTGRLHEVPVIKDALDDYANLLTISDHLNHYAFLPQAADTTDAKAGARANQVDQLLAQIFGKLNFFTSELMALPDTVLDEAAKGDRDKTAFMRHLKQKKESALPPAAEKVLTELEPSLDAPSRIREQTLGGDMDFGSFTVAGKTYPLSFSLYEEVYQKYPDTKVRRAAYQKFCQTLSRYQNTMAAGYYAQVSKEKQLATMRGYDSVIDYLLADQEVTREMFDRQIDGLMTGLAPIMRRYVTHIKNLWGLDHIGYTDLQIDIDPDFAPKVTLDQAPAMINAAIAPLGSDYQKRIMQAFDQRWVDFAPNAGKESGAFATCPYGRHPYVLMSWNDNLPALYTLVHELGHTGQMSLADEHHSILGHEPSIYVVEAPSTFHELLLTHSLLSQADDPRLKRFALSRLLSDTYFHNCVTHLLEAAFQRKVYTLIDQGQSFNAAKLNELKLSVLKAFWGDAVDLTDGMPELTWMRQSHYYMGLYSYTYSASMVVSTGAYLHLQEDGEPAAKDWLHFLQSGDMDPVTAAKSVGVDITTDRPLKTMIHFLDTTEKQIEALSAQIK